MMFLKECKKTMMSLTYLIFVAVLLLFGYTEIGTNLDRFDQIVPPQKGLESYGSKYEDNKELIALNAVHALFDEYISASYTAYPLRRRSCPSCPEFHWMSSGWLL
jgi:ABC-2 type transport system permease protein